MGQADGKFRENLLALQNEAGAKSASKGGDVNVGWVFPLFSIRDESSYPRCTVRTVVFLGLSANAILPIHDPLLGREEGGGYKTLRKGLFK